MNSFDITMIKTRSYSNSSPFPLVPVELQPLELNFFLFHHLQGLTRFGMARSRFRVVGFVEVFKWAKAVIVWDLGGDRPSIWRHARWASSGDLTFPSEKFSVFLHFVPLYRQQLVP